MQKTILQKTVLITGATGGIGSEIAHRFAQSGYKVAIAYNSNIAKAEQLKTALKGDGHIIVQCNVIDSESIKAAFQYVADTWGYLSALVNNAGTTKFVEHSDLDALEDDLIDTIFQTNCRGAFACVRASRTLLEQYKSKSGQNSCIVNITSIAGESGMGSNIAYCASKAALDTMTKSLARAMSPYARVMAVAPGLVDTDFVKGLDVAWRKAQEQKTPLKRLATTQEIANAVHSCCDILTFSTGRTIYVDGGIHLL